MITPQQFKNPQIKPKWQLPAGVMESVVAFNCRKYGFPRPVGAWPLWEGAGNRALDYSGHGNNGEFVNAPAWVSDGLDFVASNSDYIDIDGYKGIGGANPRTIVARINSSASTLNEYQIIYYGNDDVNGEAWRFFIDGGGILRIEVHGGYKLGVQNILDGSNHDVVVSYKGTNVTDAILYIDGKVEGTGASVAQAVNTNLVDDVLIGRRNDVLDPRYFEGIIKYVYMYNVDLSAAQVKFLYENPYFMYEIPEELYGYISAISDTGLFDAKLRIKDSSIVLVDGLLRLKDKKIHLLDGKTKILDVATNLADGKVVVQDAGAHTFDTKNRATGDSNPLTVSVTPTSGATLLVLTIVTYFSTARTGGAPTFNGVALTQVGTVEAAEETNVEMWYLANPSIGTYNVSIPNTNTRIMYVVASVYKASTGFTSKFDVVNQSNNTTANPSLSVTPTVNGAVIVDVMGSGYGDAPTGNSDVVLYSVDSGSYSDNHQYELQATAGLTSHWWTVAADDWCMIVAAFKLVAIATNMSDGKIQIKDSTINLADGKVQVQDIATSLADGKVQVKDVITSQADGKVKVLDVVTSLADGKVKVQDVGTNLADGKVQIKDIATGLADGKVKIIEYVTNLADGKINIKDAVANVVDGKVRIKDAMTGLADGKVKVIEYVTNLADGKVVVKDISTGLADGKVKVKDAITGLADGLVKVQEKVSSLADGKVRIKDKVTGLADGLMEVVGSVTSNVDGKVRIKDITTTLADSKVKIIEKVTSLADGKVRIKDVTTGIADGKVRIKDKVTSLADGKIKIKNLATSLADGKIKIKDTVTDLLDGKVTITGLITGHPWFYRRKQ